MQIFIDNIYCIVSIGRNLNFTFDNFILFEYFSLIIYKKIKFITPVETNIEISFNTVDSYFACSQISASRSGVYIVDPWFMLID